MLDTALYSILWFRAVKDAHQPGQLHQFGAQWIRAAHLDQVLTQGIAGQRRLQQYGRAAAAGQAGRGQAPETDEKVTHTYHTHAIHLAHGYSSDSWLLIWFQQRSIQLSSAPHFLHHLQELRRGQQFVQLAL